MDNCRDFCQNRLRSFLMYRVGLLIVALALAPGSSAFAQQQAPQVSDKLRQATEIYLSGDRAKALGFANKCLDEGDYDTAFRLLMRLAGTDGIPAAQERIGLMYENGLGVAKSPDTALNWYQMSAMQGDPAGQIALARLYQEGAGIKRDSAAALQWYRKEIGRAHV